MPNYNAVTPEIIAQLEKVAPGHVVVGADVNPDYSRDEMPIYGTRMPEVSIDVQSTEEVADIMKICYENNIPVTTRGAGIGLAGGCTPICGGVVICTMRMNKILSENTGKPIEVVTADCERDNFMTAEEALEYGLIDKVFDKH